MSQLAAAFCIQVPMLEMTVAAQRTVKVKKRNGLRLELSVGRSMGAVFIGLGSFAISYRYPTESLWASEATSTWRYRRRFAAWSFRSCHATSKKPPTSPRCSKNEFAAMKRSGGAIPQKRLAMNVAISVKPASASAPSHR
jgi:hypothetical protein